MVFYLKYRPKKISELDSSELISRLENVLRGKLPDKIPHAFLFTGPKGLGKTSTARILAKAINCTNRKGDDVEPCNKCESCKAINSGISLDVMELDGASNRGIDEIRDLREKIRLSPLSSHKKIYIIDEVHMLTTEAFNALLKTLEEPPSHAVFILCTTEPQKVPATIISRCVHIKFDKATDKDLVHSFNRIIKGEEIKAEPEALLQIARLSDGSFRDGVKILEELSQRSSNITAAVVEKEYKTQTIGKNISELISAFAVKDAKKAIKIIDALTKEGVDFKYFTESLIGELHKNLLASVSGEELQLNLNDTLSLIEKLIGSHMSLKYAILPQLPLELLIVEWCSDSVATPSKESFQDSQPKASTVQIKASGPVLGNDKILIDLIERVGKNNFSIAGVLRGCKVVGFEDDVLSLSTNYKFHKERLSERKTLDLLEENLNKISGKSVKVVIL